MAPLLGASATTSLGMLSLATSDVVAVRTFGIGSAVGIMVDFMISLVLMPTLLSLVKPERRETPHERYLIHPLQAIAGLSTRRPRLVATCAIGAGVIAAVGMLRLRVDTNASISSASHTHQPVGRRDRSRARRCALRWILLEGPPESNSDSGRSTG